VRLANIKLAGFKSFVEPTLIPVVNHLVGIVGPNGCGKSNIIDAVRWVLGESKASTLRGESMQDVIFSGSANRKAVGRASVELLFDNSMGKVIGQWASYTEISIKRVLQRDGDSTYYINNLPVRRRDITDIFLGTGIGGRGYAIIEQGMISRIIEAKPQDLKIFLEEAAGISRYQERRHETSLHLMDTRKNLTRIEDILGELKIQLEHLETQAKVAQQFKTFQDELNITQSLLWLQGRQEAINQQVAAEKELQQLTVDLDVETAKQYQAEKHYEETRAQEYAASDNLQQIQGKLYAKNAEIGRLEQEIQFLRKNNERLTQQIQDVENRLLHNQQQKGQLSENLLYWRQEADNAQITHKISLQKHTEENEKLPEIELNFQNCQEELTAYRRDLLLTEQSLQHENSHISHTTKSIQQLELRHARLIQEQTELPKLDQSVLAQLRKDLLHIEDALVEIQKTEQTIEEKLAVTASLKEEAANKVQILQQTITKLSARFDALQSLQQKIENNKALSIWQNKYQLDILPRLWQSVQIEKDWENALEAVLREQLNSIEINQLEKLQNWIADLPTGKWAVHEVGEISLQPVASDPIKWKPLVTHITSNHAKMHEMLADWLSHIFVVENIHEGFKQRMELQAGEKLVTREGHIFTRYSLIFYAPDSQLHGVLSRQQELNAIQIEIKQSESKLEKQQSILNDAEHQYIELDAAIRLAQQKNKQLYQRRHDLQISIIKHSQINDHALQRNQQIQSELKEIESELDSMILQQESAKLKHHQYGIRCDVIKNNIQQSQSTWEAANQLLVTHRQSIQVLSKEMQEVVFHIKTCDSKIIDIGSSFAVINEDNKELIATQSKLLNEQKNLDETSLTNQLYVALTERRELEQTVSRARDMLEETTQHLREINSARMVSEQRLNILREALNQARLKEQAANISMQQFNELINTSKVNNDELLSRMNIKNLSKLQLEINRLTIEIKALGAVNLASLNELDLSRQREVNLNLQLEDLNSAIRTLENVIQQIDHETQTRLQTTFDAVNHHLNKIFPVIFAGGQAKLVLSEGKIFDSGLLLMAQPPGKKNSSIHLLSGGEKALTALALIFSLFQLNPAPFCLLDEVDAPLDDSNTGRFCELVKEMSKQTQFLFISHNKIAMEMAQQLIGITMQEQGVSRVVAVDIAEAIKLGKRNNNVH